jgi:WD40 repeat protein
MRSHRSVSSGVLIILGLLLVPLSTPTTGSSSDTPAYRELWRPDRGGVMAIAWHPSDRFIAVASGQGIWIYTDAFEDVDHVETETLTVRSLAWNPEGTLLASGHEDGTIRIWSVSSQGKISPHVPSETLTARHGIVFSLAWSPVSDLLASISDEGATPVSDAIVVYHTLRIWDVPSGRLVHTFELGGSSMAQRGNVVRGSHLLAWSADGHRLASEGASPSKDHSGAGKEIWTWDVQTGDVVEQITLPANGQLASLDWDEPGETFFCSAVNFYMDDFEDSDSIFVIDGAQDATGPRVRELAGHLDSVTSLDWNKHRGWIASGSADDTVRIWDVETQALRATLWGHRGDVVIVQWSTDGTKLASVGLDHAVRIWTHFEDHPFPDAPLLASIHTDSGMESLAWSPDGHLIASAHEDGTIRLWDATTFEPLLTLKAHQSVQQVAWNKDGTLLASRGYAPYLTIWSVKQLEHAVRATAIQIDDTDQMYTMAWSPSQNLLARVPLRMSGTQTVQIYDPMAGEILRTYTADRSVFSSGDLAWSPTGDLLAIGEAIEFSSPVTVIWEPETDRIWLGLGWLVIQSDWGHVGGAVYHLAWSRDDSFLVGETYNILQVWSLTRGSTTLKGTSRFFTLDKHGWLSDVAVSPSSRWIATATRDSAEKIQNMGVILWDSMTGWPIDVFRFVDVNTITWSPDSAQLAGGGYDGQIRIWDTSQLSFASN